MIEPRQCLRHNSVPAGLSSRSSGSVVAPVGLPATICCEPRQARKGAAAAADSGAGERWAGVATILCYHHLLKLITRVHQIQDNHLVGRSSNRTIRGFIESSEAPRGELN